MTFNECSEWIKALGQCRPNSRSVQLRAVLAELSGHGALERWEIGFAAGSDNFSAISLRYFGGGEDYSGFAQKVFSLLPGMAKENRIPPPNDFPWLSVRWNLKKDVCESACRYAGSGSFKLKASQALGLESRGTRILFSPNPASDDLLSDASLAPFFSSLFPVKDIVTEWEVAPGRRPQSRERWSLRFSEAVAWPRFVCSSMADPFAGDSSRFAYLLLNRRVTELSFEGGALSVYLRS